MFSNKAFLAKGNRICYIYSMTHYTKRIPIANLRPSDTPTKQCKSCGEVKYATTLNFKRTTIHQETGSVYLHNVCKKCSHVKKNLIQEDMDARKAVKAFARLASLPQNEEGLNWLVLHLQREDSPTISVLQKLASVK